MKYVDHPAIGATSRTQDCVNQLWKKIRLIRDKRNSKKYEREFQKWAEELIYQLDKTVTTISHSPADPVNDCADLLSFLRIIEENKLDTSDISGFEHKEKFDQTLLKAQNLLDNLNTTAQVKDYIHQMEPARLQRERLLAEEADEDAFFAQIIKIIFYSRCLSILVVIIISLYSSFIQLLVVYMVVILFVLLLNWKYGWYDKYVRNGGML